MNTPTEVLFAQDVSKKYGKRWVLKDAKLSLFKGKTVGVVGESGSGKTTLANILLDLTPPTSGKVLFKGKDIKELDRKEYKKFRLSVQAVFQNPQSSLNPKMRIWEIVTEGLVVNKILTRKPELIEKARKLLIQVGIKEDFLEKYPHRLSGGQKQRVAIARALAMNPEIIIADEPTASLDVSVQAQIVNLFLEIQEKYGVGYLFISHSLAVIDAVSDEVAVTYGGRIVEYGKTPEVFKNPLHPYTKLLLGKIDAPDGFPDEFGCPFFSRCPYKKKACKDYDLKPVGREGRLVRCILFS